MTDPRPDYIRCIAAPGIRKLTLCGRSFDGEWAFVSYEHARNTVNNGSALLPCDECEKIAKEQQTKEGRKA